MLGVQWEYGIAPFQPRFCDTFSTCFGFLNHGGTPESLAGFSVRVNLIIHFLFPNRFIIFFSTAKSIQICQIIVHSNRLFQIILNSHSNRIFMDFHGFSVKSSIQLFGFFLRKNSLLPDARWFLGEHSQRRNPHWRRFSWDTLW